MKQSFLIIAVSLSLLVNSFKVSAQGCSDAGVCTLNSIKEHKFNSLPELNKTNFSKSGVAYGIGEYDITIVTPYVEYTSQINDKINLSGKLTYAFISGELGNTNNLADVFLSSSFYVLQKEESNILATLGFKIPLNNANTKEDNNLLPMHYQSSMGTYDVLLGLGYVYNNLGVSIAYQQPVINSNENEFISSTNPLLTESKYPTGMSYERKSDLMLRLSYSILLFENKVGIRPGLLGIYHLANDTYVDQNNIKQTHEGSQGLTLNGNLFVNYRFAENKILEFSFGSPFITRDSRPDGLTRKLVAGLEYQYSF